MNNENSQEGRFFVLKAIYDLSKYDIHRSIKYEEVERITQFESGNLSSILNYLNEKNLVRIGINYLTITAQGIDETEKSRDVPEKPTPHFPANIYYNTFSASVTGIQQGGTDNLLKNNSQFSLDFEDGNKKVSRDASIFESIIPSPRLPKIEDLCSKSLKRQLFTDAEHLERLCGEVDRQLNEFGVIPATGVARALLLQEQYELALKLFAHLLKKISPLNKDLYIVYGSIGYCLSGMGFYREAVAYLKYVETITNSKTYFSWHAIAAAYCYWHLGQKEDYLREIRYAKSRPEYHKEVELYEKLYPEIKNDLD